MKLWLIIFLSILGVLTLTGVVIGVMYGFGEFDKKKKGGAPSPDPSPGSGSGGSGSDPSPGSGSDPTPSPPVKPPMELKVLKTVMWKIRYQKASKVETLNLADYVANIPASSVQISSKYKSGPSRLQQVPYITYPGSSKLTVDLSKLPAGPSVENIGVTLTDAKHSIVLSLAILNMDTKTGNGTQILLSGQTLGPGEALVSAHPYDLAGKKFYSFGADSKGSFVSSQGHHLGKGAAPSDSFLLKHSPVSTMRSPPTVEYLKPGDQVSSDNIVGESYLEISFDDQLCYRLGNPDVNANLSPEDLSKKTLWCEAKEYGAGSPNLYSAGDWNNLRPGQKIYQYNSGFPVPYGTFKNFCIYQADGNFACYGDQNGSTNPGSNYYDMNVTSAKPKSLVMQADGNLCVYPTQGAGYGCGQAKASGAGPFSLVVQRDGSLCINTKGPGKACLK
jgi:hypothetical protein